MRNLTFWHRSSSCWSRCNISLLLVTTFTWAVPSTLYWNPVTWYTYICVRCKSSKLSSKCQLLKKQITYAVLPSVYAVFSPRWSVRLYMLSNDHWLTLVPWAFSCRKAFAFRQNPLNRKQCTGVIFGTPGTAYLCYSLAVLLSVYTVFSPCWSVWLYMLSDDCWLTLLHCLIGM